MRRVDGGCTAVTRRRLHQQAVMRRLHGGCTAAARRLHCGNAAAADSLELGALGRLGPFLRAHEGARYQLAILGVGTEQEVDLRGGVACVRVCSASHVAITRRSHGGYAQPDAAVRGAGHATRTRARGACAWSA